MHGLNAKRRALTRRFGEATSEHIVFILDSLDRNDIIAVVNGDGVNVLSNFDVQGQDVGAQQTQY